MALRRAPIAAPSQPPLSGLESAWLLPRINGGNNISIRRYLAEVGEFYIAQGIFDAVTDELRAQVAPHRLIRSLVDREVVVDQDGRGINGVGFKDENGIWHRVALAPTEGVVYLGNVEAYARGGRKIAQASPKQRFLTNPDRDAPRRAAEHTMRSRTDRMQSFVNVFKDQQLLLHQIGSASSRRGRNFALLGSSNDMHTKMTLFAEVVDTTLEAVGDQLAWTNEDRAARRRAVQEGFFANRENDANIDYLNNTANMLSGYLAVKVASFEDPIKRGEAYLAARKPPVDTVQ